MPAKKSGTKKATMTSHSEVMRASAIDPPGMELPHVAFTGQDPDDPEVAHDLIAIDRSVWKEMGSPETITVTVVPGDTLND